MKIKPVLLTYCLIILALTGCDKQYDFDLGEFPPVVYDEKYKGYEENPFVKVTTEPVSTFSVDADGGSYANMRRYLYLGQTPPKASVRIEEYINYFTFDYQEPTSGENVSLESEISTCPWNAKNYLLRLGIKGLTIPANDLPNSNYVFLIDVSGSMNSPDKLGILKIGFKTLTDNLRDQDRISIVTYAGDAGILLESAYGSEKDKIKSAIDKLGAGGSTAGAAGITTAYEIAQKNFIVNGNNRVILGTDGDFNVGPSTTDELVKLIEEKRQTGIYLTVLGVGEGNLNDHMMEQIANKGNGNYEYIDNAKQIQKVFTYELTKFYTIAKDSKIQLTFNQNMIESYRLIGYENRKLDSEEFENDSTDAGEIGSAQTITALYEVVLLDASNKEKYAQFEFRYKKPNETQSQLITHDISMIPKEINSCSENMRFAASVTGLGLLMKQSKYKRGLTKQMVLDLGEKATTFDPNGYRKEFIELVKNWND
ncbi:MAG: von Willebrand factor type A domain-containing protein [Sphingobacteriales bacterium]|nr:von Willebrand factor type A domain-containing protein [Sphingobacteriales bacterium]MBK6891047.1 von Willebrand factor type A domain-containing protein [Sphingobacteriales bacterium]MBK7527123.1 von Willebrand factor type A domain-containing protein [Sphingobacteriales bacterium]MBL0247739.1 von Willebrand factor type A domain-containing protein [Sphingobacteriales bacterium]MDA0199520.1 von Willebrand factor type A domain-containing protein [Bacteroidota bacterium]